MSLPAGTPSASLASTTVTCDSPPSNWVSDMRSDKPQFRPIWSRLLVSGLLCAIAWSCFGQDTHLESTGARFGFFPTGAGRDFHQAEGFVRWDLPWNWDLGSRWRLQSRMETSAGWLGESGFNAALFSFGPALVLGWQGWPVSLDCGLSPTVLTRWEFPTKDLGSAFQFASHGGINFDLSSKLRLSYRFQHMSNGSLVRHNPGLNLNVLGLSYLF
jgi:lipid A 3-O-deacylase